MGESYRANIINLINFKYHSHQTRKYRIEIKGESSIHTKESKDIHIN